MPHEPTHQAAESFSIKLERLFRAVRREDGTRYVPREVAEWCSAEGYSLSGKYLYALLKGDRTVPSLPVAQGIAAFFQAPTDYFNDDDRGHYLARQYERLAILAENGQQDHGATPGEDTGDPPVESEIDTIRFRAEKWSPDQRKSILDYIRFIESQQ